MSKKRDEERQAQIEEQLEEEWRDNYAPKIMPLRSGDKNAIEEEAEKFLASARREGIEGGDVYLSREQYKLRTSKEVYSTNGIPDASLISGLYKRSFNPEFGKRPSKHTKTED